MDTIQHIPKKFKRPYIKDILLSIALILALSASFGLGILSARDHSQVASPILIGESPHKVPLEAYSALQQEKQDDTPLTPSEEELLLVASKTGSKYYFTWCSNRIKEENKIFFRSYEEARQAGYSPAQTCKGLE